jgi:hypothetical protein
MNTSPANSFIRWAGVILVTLLSVLLFFFIVGVFGMLQSVIALVGYITLPVLIARYRKT